MPDASARRDPRILVVEDDGELREAVATLLRLDGFEVEEASNGREALACLRARRADAVVLDLHMPEMDGWELRVAMREDAALADLPVVVLSADVSAKARAVHTEVFLQKPFGQAELPETLRAIIERAESARSEAARIRAEIGTLAAEVAHEINNPLAFLTLDLQGARDMLPEGSEPRALVTEALAGAERIRRVVVDVRSLGSAVPPEAVPPESRVRPHPEPGDAPLERRARILVLDDEAAITRALSRLLRARHDVEVANDARHALAMLEAGARFDLLLCDLEMPGMSGVDFVEALARFRPELRERVVFMSGGGCTPRTRAFLETTSIPQLSKPFPREALDELLAARGLA